MVQVKRMSMRVEPNRDLSRAAEVTPAKKPASPGGAKSSEHVSGAAELMRALDEIPAVRPARVAQAKALLAQPDYPGDKSLERVADLLADHLKSKPGV